MVEGAEFKTKKKKIYQETDKEHLMPTQGYNITLASFWGQWVLFWVELTAELALLGSACPLGTDSIPSLRTVLADALDVSFSVIFPF